MIAQTDDQSAAEPVAYANDRDAAAYADLCAVIDTLRTFLDGGIEGTPMNDALARLERIAAWMEGR